MMNSTEVENCKTMQKLCCLASLKEPHRTIISALNVLLSIIALMGNVLIFVALQKVSSLHPPSKLLFGCLASTDFCVGLISQPLFVIFIFAPELSKLCHYSTILTNTIGFIFSGVSLLTITAISVDRLLALMLRLRYRQVVTLRRVWVLVVFFWLFSTGFSITMLYKRRIAETITAIIMLSCLVISVFCYMKIYLTLYFHQAQVKTNTSHFKRIHTLKQFPVPSVNVEITITVRLCALTLLSALSIRDHHNKHVTSVPAETTEGWKHLIKLIKVSDQGEKISS